MKFKFYLQSDCFGNRVPEQCWTAVLWQELILQKLYPRGDGFVPPV